MFTTKDFLDVGTRATVDQTLSCLVRKGAIAVKTGDRIFPSGAAAANYLGLTTQVPAQTVWIIVT